MSELSLSLLGPVRVELSGVPLGVDTRKAIALLAYLAVTRQPHARDALAALLWPEYDQTHARATLRRTLSALGKALEGTVLAVTRETIGLDASARLLLDVDEFRAHLDQCQTHEHPPAQVCDACLQRLATATALYRDDFMAGFSLRDSPAFDEWQFFEREALRHELAGALERLTRGYTLLGHYDTAITTARRWLALDRLHEPAHRYLMRLYAWSGHRAAALRQYQECAHALEQELGVEPLEPTKRLYEALKAHRMPPPTTQMASARVRAPASTTAVQTVAEAMDTARATPAATSASAGAYPLVGRSAEWEALATAYDSIRANGRVVVLEGEAGIGKTRLAEELVTHAQQQGATVISARCYDGEAGLAYAPFVAALRSALLDPICGPRLSGIPDQWFVEAGRLLPELAGRRPGLAPAPPLDGPGAQSQFFEGIRQALLAACRGSRPGVLFLDDVHWADAASLDVLAYITRRLRGEPLCLLLTARTPDVSGRARIQQMLAETQRSRMATIVGVSRLSADAVRELLGATAGVTASPHLAERLYRETEGLPFFVVEYLAAVAKGVVVADQQDWFVPGGIKDLLRSRLSLVGGASAQVLTATAVIGRWFDFETVRNVSGRGEEETVSALEDLVAQGLIRELPVPSGTIPVYDFSHEKLRSLVYDETTVARRRLLHRRAAVALAEAVQHRRDGEDLLGQVAHHYQLAGDQPRAAEYYKLAGERARRLYANTEALAHLRAALALGHPETAVLHEAIGDLYTSLGEYGEALDSYAVVAPASPEVAARVERKTGDIHARRGELDQAQRHFEAALNHLGTTSAQGERARIYADWSLVAHRRGQLDQAWELASQARAFAAEPEDRRALAQAHNMLGVLASSQGDVEGAICHLERSLTLAEAADDTSARAAALNNLALALASRGETEGALAHAETALTLCSTEGDRHHEAALHNNIADLLHALGRPDEAMAHLKAAVRIYAEIGVESGAVRPEIWKLAEW